MPDINDNINPTDGVPDPAGLAQPAPTVHVEPDEPEYETECESCGDGLDWDDGYRSEYDDVFRCNYCHSDHLDAFYEEEERRNEESALIHYYSYRPTLRFWAHNPTRNGTYMTAGPTRDEHGPRLYMGFELEVEARGNDREHGAEKVLEASSVSADGSRLGSPREEELLYLKEDGSIAHGFEIVTHPCTMEFYEKHFPWQAIELLRAQGFSSWNSRSCGLHIHMNRSSFINDKHLWKFMVFIYKNPATLQRFAGRTSSYAKFDIDSFLHCYDRYSHDNYGGSAASTFIRHAKGLTRNDDRYTAVNLQNVHTIELRFFRPSLRSSTVVAALQFCAALHEYTRELATPTVMRGGLEFGQFAAWVRGNENYTVLADRIAARLSSESDDQ